MRKLFIPLLIASAAQSSDETTVISSNVLPPCCSTASRFLPRVRDSRSDPSRAARRLNRFALYKDMRDLANPLLTISTCTEFQAANKQMMLPRLAFSAAAIAINPTAGPGAFASAIHGDKKDRSILQRCRAKT